MENKIKLFNKMINKLIELNNITKPDWKKSLTTTDWRAVLVAEIGEAIDSLGSDVYWWKNKIPDYENLKVEMVDILHFYLSILAYNEKSIQEMLGRNIIANFELKKHFDTKKELKSLLVELASNIYDYEKFNEYFVRICKVLGIKTFEDLYKEYMVKNVLNKFRQDNGYKQGNYKKIWLIVYEKDYGDNLWETRLEDNYFAYRFAKEIEADENFDENLYKKLQEKYEEIKD